MRAWSPQGRFAADAAILDGGTLDTVEAHGKHLFHRWVDAPVLHVHLGLVGKFPSFTGDIPEPSSGTRLALAGDDAATYLAGPMICRLIDEEEMDRVIGGLGPDPIRSRWGRRRFVAGLARRRKPVAAALLDQELVAGIGNVYRCELLFLMGIHPATPAPAIPGDTASELWDLIVDELRSGLELGRIVTVRPGDVGTHQRRTLTGDERLYVYQRDGLPCRRCGTPIRIGEIGSRSTWWCPSCQPPPA